jgi:DNA repair exonuclease SbcCD nuclease subunit
MTVRFLHASDLHLDTPFTGLSAVEPGVAAMLRDASLAAWDSLVELALARRVDFVVLAGDIYDGQHRGVRAQLRLVRGLERLTAAGVSTFIAHGNHDPLGGYSAIRNWPARVHVFGSERVERVTVQRDGRELAAVYGISYAQPAVRDNLAALFRREGDGGFHVGVLHCSVGGNGEHDAYSPCEVADLERAGMDYWGLGHIHRHTVLSTSGCVAVYSGNTQGRSVKSSECGPKGVMIVEANPAGDVRSMEHVAIDAARFVHEEFDASDVADLAALRTALLERAAALRAEHAGRPLVVRVTLIGAGPVHADLARPGATEDLLAELRRECEGERPVLYVESVRDRTRATMELDRIAERGDFAADVLAQARALSRDPERLDALLGAHGADLRRIPARWTRDLPPVDPQAILDQATWLAMEMLTQDGGMQ